MARQPPYLPPPTSFPPPPPPPSLTPSSSDDPYALIKIKQFASQGLHLKFNGQLIHFANFIQEATLHINTSFWKDATLITIKDKQYNLLYDFMSIPKDDVIAQATKRWTDPALLSNHNRKATKEFHIKLLSLFLLNSVTADFRTIKNHADDLLRNDGQVLFWLLCNHVHSSKNAFHKSIKDIIKARSIANDNKGNVKFYVSFIKHQLKHLQLNESDTSMNDLLDAIFAQLSLTGTERFTNSVDDWYEEHMSNQTPLTPLLLLNKAESNIQLLRCANK